MNNIDHITINGARVNNLQNINLHIPLEKIICIAGPSGSGKTSLAFKTILAESKRRLINSFPNSMKLFAEKPAAVDVDHIAPVLPVFGLPQINPVLGSRSTVADQVGLTELLQGFFYHCSEQRCPVHHQSYQQKSYFLQLQDQLKKNNFQFVESDIAHVFVDRAIYQLHLGRDVLPSRCWDEQGQGICSFDKDSPYWEIGRFRMGRPEMFEELMSSRKAYEEFSDFYLCLKGGKELVKLRFSREKACPKCESEYIPRNFDLFSPLNAQGACSDCDGFGAKLVYDIDKIVDKKKSLKEKGVLIFKNNYFPSERKAFYAALKKMKFCEKTPIGELPESFWDFLENGKYQYGGLRDIYDFLERKRYRPHIRMYTRSIQTEQPCLSCHGSRMNRGVGNFFVYHQQFTHPKTLIDLSQMKLRDLLSYLELVPVNDSNPAAQKSYKKLISLLTWSVKIGLGHLQLLRKSKSLSAGEYQRLLLLKYLSFEGTDTLFIFDEPSVGLTLDHIEEFFQGLLELKNRGNTILLVDHNPYFHHNCDHLIVMGQGSGVHGGKIVYQGSSSGYQDIAPMYKRYKIPPRPAGKKKVVRNTMGASIALRGQGLQVYGLKLDHVDLYLHKLHWVTGDSGVGKTAFFSKVLANELQYCLTGQHLIDEGRGSIEKLVIHRSICGMDVIDANLNRYTSRSTVGSLTDLGKCLRNYYALHTLEGKMNYYQEGHFSKNSQQGRCPSCEGRGEKVIELQYLESVALECEDCHGIGIRPEYAQVSDGVMTFAEAMRAPLEDVFERIPLTPKYKRILGYSKDLNLSYLNIERTINSLSGGEKQRIYLLSKLISKVSHSILFLENISFGLSAAELTKIGLFLQKLARESGNTLLIIDQNPLLGSYCDYQLHVESDHKQAYIRTFGKKATK